MATVDSLAPELLSEVFEHLVLDLGTDSGYGWCSSQIIQDGVDFTSANALVAGLAKEPFPLLRHLALQGPESFNVWSQLSAANFPSLFTLEFRDAPTLVADAFAAAATNTPPTLQALIFEASSTPWDERAFTELLCVIAALNLEGLRRIEVGTVSKRDLACEAGFALLDECEKRSISLLFHHEFVTRDMLEEAPSQGAS
ncbi:hypothetical protein RQP46_007656 [Phenoliferia psychrophenolica]